jgi:cholesterol transport system auxiliary component
VIRRLLIAVAALAAAGCTGSLLESHAEPLQAYRLAPVATAPGGETVPAALAVARPRAMESLDSDYIAVLRPGHEFDHFAGVRWAEPAPQMLQRMLVDAFAGDARFTVTVAAPSRVPAEYLLDVELREFSAIYAQPGAAPKVRVQWQATLVDTRRGRSAGSVLATAEVTAGTNRREAILAAFQQATAQAVTETVRGIRSAGAR